MLVDWIRTHVGPNPTILIICDGSIIAADTGLLDGRAITSNPGDFAYIEPHASGARLLQNLRYVDDGNIVTSSAVSSGIDASLHLVDRFAGRATALDVARQVGYPYTAALDNPVFAPPENARVSIGLVAGYEAPQQLGVLLYDRVSEFSLAALLDTYLGSASTKAFVMASERTIVHSLDGFLFVPRNDFSSVPALDRVLGAAGVFAATHVRFSRRAHVHPLPDLAAA